MSYNEGDEYGKQFKIKIPVFKYPIDEFVKLLYNNRICKIQPFCLTVSSILVRKRI